MILSSKGTLPTVSRSWQSGKGLGPGHLCRYIVAPRCISLHAMRCNDLQCRATTCNEVQRLAMHCNEVQCIAKGVGAMTATCDETLGSGEPGCGKSPSARSWQAVLAGVYRGPNHFRVHTSV